MVKEQTILTEERLNSLRKYLKETFKYGKFEASSNAFKDVLNVNSGTSHYMKILIEEGFLICTEKAKVYRGTWQKAKYEIPSITNILPCKPNVDELENDEEVICKTIINVEDYILESFNGTEFKLYKTDKGYVFPVSNFTKVLSVSRQSINQILKRNMDLFDNWLVNIKLTSTINATTNNCLTRDGVIGLIMKISYSRLDPTRQTKVLEFQKWAIEKLGQLVSEGKVVLKEKEHMEVQNNIKAILNLSETDIDVMFNDMEKSISEKIKVLCDTTKKYKEQSKEQELHINTLQTINNKYYTKTAQLQERINELKWS